MLSGADTARADRLRAGGQRVPPFSGAVPHAAAAAPPGM